MQAMQDILQTPYMACAVGLIDEYIQKCKQSQAKASIDVFNESKNSVDDFLAERKRIGEIKDEKQVALSSKTLREKYDIRYETKIMPLVCFATVNFYNEINNPQQRGMFKFFDKAFIAKNVDSNFICKLSTLPNFVNEKL
jgi:hypothetical protein